MAWDPQLNEIIFCEDGGHIYAWNGSIWSQLTTTGSGPNGTYESMVWDNALSSMVIVGFDNNATYNSTYLLSNLAWTKLSGGIPTARRYEMMAAVPSANQVVLFGGYVQGSTGYQTLGDTWVLNAQGAWVQQSVSASPHARANGAMTYDTTLGAAVLFGGSSFGATYNDTWAWTGTAWVAAQAGISSPPAEDRVSLAEDPTNALVLVNSNNQTETYNPQVPVLGVQTSAPSGGLTTGDSMRVDVTVSNAGSEPISSSNVLASLNSSVLVPGTNVLTWQGSSTALHALPLSAAVQNDPSPPQSCVAPVCAVQGLTESLQVGALQPGQTVIEEFLTTVVGSVVGCQSLTLPVVATNVFGSAAPVQAPTTVCGGGLGLENWWSYDKTAVGPDATAQVNVANGNLVVQQQDSTEIGSHGALGFSMERTYNSQDNMSQLLDENIGSGWQLNVGQTDAGTSGGLDVAGLEIPNLESATNPLAVTYIDRDGTRMVFQPKAANVGLGLGPLGSIDVSAAANNPTSAISSLLGSLSGPGSVLGGLLHGQLPTLNNSSDAPYRVCLDATYQAPPGADLQLYRYVGVSSGQQANGCSDLSSHTEPPVVLGWTVVRPDRLRYDFSANGQLLSMTDPSGNQMMFGYENPLSAVSAAVGPTVTLGRLTSITLDNVATGRQICGAQPAASQGACPHYSLRYNNVLGATSPTSLGTTRIDVTDPAGRVTTYILDGGVPAGEPNVTSTPNLVNHLTQVWDPGNPYPQAWPNASFAVTSSTPQPTEAYTYNIDVTPGAKDSLYRCSGGGGVTPAESGLLCSITDADGGTTTIGYTPAPIGPERTQWITDRRSNAAAGGPYGKKLTGQTNTVNQTGTETVYTYHDSSAYTTADSADPSIVGGTNPTGCVSNTKCQRTRYLNIDPEGRVGEIDEGDAGDNYLHQTGYFWDGDQIPSCEQPSKQIDNDLCQKIVRGAVSTAAFAPNGATTESLNGVTVADQETNYVYNDVGQTLSKTVLRNPHPGWTAADTDTTTYGYHSQYYDAASTSATPATFDDSPVGNGQVASTALSTTNYPAAVKADGPVSYWQVDDKPAGSGPTVAADTMGQNNGTYGAVNFQQPGAVSGDFGVTAGASTGDMFSVTNPVGFAPNDTNSPFSIETWVKTTSTAEQLLVSQYDNNGYGYYLCLYNGYPAFVLASNQAQQANDDLDVLGQTAVSDGAWHMIDVTSDGTGKAAGVTVYVDGKPAAPLVAKDSLSGSALPAAGTPLTYGYEGGSVPFPAGTGADDTSVYAKNLTATQVANHYAQANPSQRTDATTLGIVSDQTSMVTPRGNTPGADYANYLTRYRRDIPIPTANPYPAPNSTAATAVCGTAATGNTGLLCETDSPSSPGVVDPPPTPPAGVPKACTAATTEQFSPSAPTGIPAPTAGYTWSCTQNTYDQFGEKTAMYTPNENNASQPGHYSYTYYPDTTNCSGTSAANCDLSGNVSAGGWLEAVTDPTGNSIVYAYDRAGNTARTWDRDATAGKTVPGNSWENPAAPPSSQYAETDYDTPVTGASIAGGGTSTLAIAADGTVRAWGANDQGQLGNGTTTASSTPVQVTGLTHVTQVASNATGTANSDSTSYALANGVVYAWGGNTTGELANGGTSNSSTAQPIQFSLPSGQNQPYVIAVAAGGGHGAALDALGNVWTWGADNYGQAGNGTTSSTPLTKAVKVFSGVSSIAAGWAGTYAAKADGTVWAWGLNNVGQDGTGTTGGNITNPTQVPGISNARSVAAGYAAAYALRADGTVAAWGYNGYGELGNNTTTGSNTPVTVNGLTGVRELGAGDEDVAALKQDGTVWAWGYDGTGQLGDNAAVTNRTTPTQVPGVQNQVALTAGWAHVVTAGPDGTLTGWGTNTNGQLGNNTTTGTSGQVQPVNADNTAFTALNPFSAPWRYKRATRDPIGNLTAQNVDPDGYPTVTRPARGEAIYTTAYDTWDNNDAAGNPITVETPQERASNKSIANDYDAFGNKVVTVDADGDTVETDYDSVNRATSTETDRGTTNISNAPTCGHRASATAAPDLPANDFYCQTSTTYNGADNKITTTDADQVTTTTTYDGAGEKTVQQTPRTTGSSPVILTTGWNYDADGNVTDTCPPNEYDTTSGNAPGSAGSCTSTGVYSTHTVFDNAGKQVESYKYRNPTTKLITATAYDADGNPVAATSPNAGVTAPTGTATNPADDTGYLVYDALDRKTQEVTPRQRLTNQPGDPLVTETTTWQYDPSGNTTAVIAPGNQDTGSGAQGALVVDGTTASASTDGVAHPAGNPFQVPAGAQYSTVTVQNGGAITGPAGSQTLNLDAMSTIIICSTCTVTMAGDGYQGGAGATNGTGTAGNGPSDVTAATGGAANSTAGGGGGGGGHNGAGSGGQTASQGGSGGTGGAGYGQTDFTVTPNYGIGSGAAGGGAGPTGSTGGTGGSGGGFIHLSAGGSVTVASGGLITAAGTAGTAGTGSGGGGGGGAGGGIWIQSPTITTPAGTTNVTGGAGGGPSNGNNGGNGATGYVQTDTGPGANTPGSKLNEVTEYAYDPDNRTTDTVVGAQSTSANLTVDNGSDIAPDQGGGFNERTRTFYDADGNTVATLPPNAFTWNPTTQSLVTDWSYAKRTDYDLDGHPTVTYSPRYNTNHPDVPSISGDDGAGDQQTSQCPTGPDPQYSAGLVAYPSDVGVCKTVTSYDPAGRKIRQTLPTSTTSSDNRYQTWTYTPDGLMTAATGPDPSNPGGRITTDSYYYDGDGRQTEDTKANGLISTTSYTADGLTSQTSSCGGVKGDCSDSGGVTHTVNSTYDANGQLITQTDPDAQSPASGLTADDYTTDTTWTPDGLKASVRAPGLGHANFDTTTYTYDNDGNPTAVYSPSATARDATNPAGLPTTYTYTQDDLAQTETVPISTSSSRTTTYRYGPAGEKLSTDIVTTGGAHPGDAGAQSVAYLPDGLPSSQTGHNGAGDITTAYDQNGNPTTITDTTSGIKVTAGYYLDELAQNVNETGPVTDNQKFAYNAAGQTTVNVDQPGSLPVSNTTTAYGDADLPTAQAWSLDSADNTTWAYNKIGQPTSQTDQNQKITTAYNADGTVASATNQTGSTTLSSYAYTYDDDENQVTQTASGSSVGTDSSTYTYAYNPAKNVTTWTDHSGKQHSAGYDHDNNRITETDPATSGTTTTTSTFAADNSVTGSTTTASAGGPSVTQTDSYNPAGNLSNDSCLQDTYDGFDRLTQSYSAAAGTPANGCGTIPAATSNYTYDGLDRQATDTTTGGANPGTTTDYYNGLGTTVQNQGTTSGTSPNLRYELGTNGQPLQLQAGSTTNYLDTDGHGNITNLITAAGTNTCSARYDPFGNPETPTGTTSNSVCNTGASPNIDWYRSETRDPNTDNYQLGSRTYDPKRDTFNTPDHYRVSGPNTDLSVGTDPLTQNTYTYVNGNPLNADDPNGHCAQGPGVTCKGIAVSQSATQVADNEAKSLANTPATSQAGAYSNLRAASAIVSSLEYREAGLALSAGGLAPNQPRFIPTAQDIEAFQQQEIEDYYVFETLLHAERNPAFSKFLKGTDGQQEYQVLLQSTITGAQDAHQVKSANLLSTPVSQQAGPDSNGLLRAGAAAGIITLTAGGNAKNKSQEVAKQELDADAEAVDSPGEVAVDNNVLVYALDNGALDDLDLALAGRTPVVSPQAYKEYLDGEKGGMQSTIDGFLENRNGRKGAEVTDEDVSDMQEYASTLYDQFGNQRALKTKDAAVVASALEEDLPLITNDNQVIGVMSQSGFPVERFEP